jgi:hypothetical protein
MLYQIEEYVGPETGIGNVIGEISKMSSSLLTITQPYLQGPVMVYCGWILIHYISSHMYSTYCVNWSWFGLIASPITTSTPICRGLSWIIYESSNTISNIWVLLGSTISIYLAKTRA